MPSTLRAKMLSAFLVFLLSGFGTAKKHHEGELTALMTSHDSAQRQEQWQAVCAFSTWMLFQAPLGRTRVLSASKLVSFLLPLTT
eukprot:2555373-Rhodomonas_salina.1